MDFSSKAVLKAAKDIRKEILNAHKRMKSMKKSGEHKTNAVDYKAVKKERNMKVKELLTIMKAAEYIKRVGK
jgi:hypothetical protein